MARRACVADISNLQYISPWPDLLDYPTNNVIKFKLKPLYKSAASSTQDWAGKMRLDIFHVKRTQRRHYRADAKNPVKPFPCDREPF